MIKLAQQVRGDLSGGAWWSSGESRLATPEGPAGCPLCTLCNRVLLALTTCRLEKDTESGPTGLCESLSAQQEQGCRIRTGTKGTRTGPGGRPGGGWAGSRAGTLASIFR